MREHKFRVWDKFNAVYTYSKDFENLSLFFAYCQKCVDGGNLLVLEEYTGRKDENDVEIYENDIVKSEILSGDTRINKISFEYGAFRIGLQSLNVQKDIEVIGNIHENSELLEESNV